MLPLAALAFALSCWKVGGASAALSLSSFLLAAGGAALISEPFSLMKSKASLAFSEKASASPSTFEQAVLTADSVSKDFSESDFTLSPNAVAAFSAASTSKPSSAKSSVAFSLASSRVFSISFSLSSFFLRISMICSTFSFDAAKALSFSVWILLCSEPHFSNSVPMVTANSSLSFSKLSGVTPFNFMMSLRITIAACCSACFFFISTAFCFASASLFNLSCSCCTFCSAIFWAWAWILACCACCCAISPSCPGLGGPPTPAGAPMGIGLPTADTTIEGSAGEL
mmetsp:Transcript_94203/g.304874  ORF Transcript_94203/g.304874 Transcript_94203/m.304874 type:complete len:284 (-) Transcript_94203:451-1302(-)